MKIWFTSQSNWVIFNWMSKCITTDCNLYSAVKRKKGKNCTPWQYFKEVLNGAKKCCHCKIQTLCKDSLLHSPLMSCCSLMSFLPLRPKYKSWTFHSSLRLTRESVTCQQLMSRWIYSSESVSYECAAEMTRLELIWLCVCVCMGPRLGFDFFFCGCR